MKRPASGLQYNNCSNKPKRPLSAYNIFYRFSREHIILSLSRNQDANIPYLFDEIASMDDDAILKSSKSIIEGYRFGKSYNNSNTMKKLKMHGRLGFQDLTRIMAKQWANLNPSKKSIFEMCAQEDKRIYVEKRNLWRIEKDLNIKRKLEEQVVHGKVTNINLFSLESNAPIPVINLNKHLKRTCGSDHVINYPPKHNLRRVISEETAISSCSDGHSPSFDSDKNTNDPKKKNQEIEPIFDSGEENNLNFDLDLLGNPIKSVSNIGIDGNSSCHSVIESTRHFDLTCNQKHKHFLSLRQTLLEDVFDCDSDLELFFSTLIQ